MSGEIAIVGGGIVGCAVAAFAAEAGARVTLFEASHIGAGASGRNSGAIQHPFDPILAALHGETVEIYRDLDGLALADRPAGLLLLTDDPAAAAERAADLAAAHPGLAPELLGTNELAEAEPMLAPGLDAIRLETGYPIAPASAVQAFVQRATAAGATIVRGGAVARVETLGGRVSGVRLADGTLHPADAVVVSAGPWTPAILDPTGTWRPIVRTWGVTVQVRLAESPRHILEEGVVHTVNAVLDAAHAPETTAAAGVPSLFSLVGVGEVGTVGSTFLPLEPDAVVVAPLLVERGSRLVPSLRGAPVLRLRVCARPQSLDGRPLVGGLTGVEGLVVCAGHGPWGISTGPATARLAAALALGTAPRIPPELDPQRFGDRR